jgi:amino acid transporter
MKNKKIWTIISTLAFLLGLILSMTINGHIRDFDNHHLLILAPIVLPAFGFFLGMYGIAKLQGYMKILPILAMLANLVLAAIIFIAFSFSYWQF